MIQTILTNKDAQRRIDKIFDSCFDESETLLELADNLKNNKELEEDINDLTFSVVWVFEPSNLNYCYQYNYEYSIEKANIDEFIKFLNDYDCVGDITLKGLEYHFDTEHLWFSCLILAD